MKSFKPLLLTILVLVLASCGNKTPKSENKSEENLTKSELSDEGKYGIKSGIVEYTATMMGMEVNQTLYFDEYGKKEMTEVVLDLGTIQSRTITLYSDGYMYTYDPDRKTGTKTATLQNYSSISFRNVTKEIEEKMNLKKLGNETFLDKNCEKYSVDYKDMQMTGTFLVWEGIALKTDAKVASMDMIMTAKSIDTNTSIPSEKFIVPSDVQFN